MSLSALFNLVVALIGIGSAGYLIYAYAAFIKDLIQTELRHLH